MNDFFLRSAGPEDLDELVRLEREVEQQLPDRNMFATDDKEFYEPIVRGNGHILLAFDEESHLAGVSVIRFPAADDPENLGHTLSLPEKQLLCVRHLESVFVRPDIRGKHLAERLVRENMKRTDRSGRTLSMATVWPGNAASLKLHLNLGLHIRAFALKYGGRPRFILVSEGIPSLNAAPVFVHAMDMNNHRMLLSSGFIGVGLRREPTGSTFSVEYRPLLPL